MNQKKVCHQVNLQLGFGGGEVYTAAFTWAMSLSGIPSVIYVNPGSWAWSQLELPPETRLVTVKDHTQLSELLTDVNPAWIACHTLPSAQFIRAMQEKGHYVTAFVHMPIYQRSPEPLRCFDLLFPVSRYVRDTLLEHGLCQTYEFPLYGIAHLDRKTKSTGVLKRNSCFDWDRRKFRERVMEAFEPLYERLRPESLFSRREGVTIGIVSRLTTIKQFPLLLSLISPVLKEFEGVNLEIFGAGAYTSVRDLRCALRPIASRVRFWGHQADVKVVYGQLDALLTGLPEKEALGLNVIEAQALGIPVLAPDAPPFDETVLQGVTGLRYADPRQDGGSGFRKALTSLLNGDFQFDIEAARSHLENFSEQAFQQRCHELAKVVVARQEMSQR